MAGPLIQNEITSVYSTEMPKYLKEANEDFVHEEGDLVRLVGVESDVYGVVADTVRIAIGKSYTLGQSTQSHQVRTLYRVHWHENEEFITNNNWDDGQAWWGVLELEPLDDDRKGKWLAAGGEEALAVYEASKKGNPWDHTSPFPPINLPPLPQLPPMSIPLPQDSLAERLFRDNANETQGLYDSRSIYTKWGGSK
jgi:hypothetical protein